MTSDLTEQLLREQLHAAAEGQSESYLDVDPLTALDTGHRIQRRRRVTAVAGTAAAALVLGVGGWAVLSQEAPDDRTLPAITATVNGPSVTLPLGSDPASGSAEPLSAVVTVDETSGRVEFRLQTETGSVLDSQVRTGSGRDAPWASLSDRVMAALVPAKASAFVPVWAGGVTEQETATEMLPDGRVAVAWRTDFPPTGTALAGIVWTDGTSAYTASGQPLPSVVVDDIVVFANNVSGAMGYVRQESGSISGSGDISQAYEMEVGQFPGVWAPDPSGEGGVYAAYLPPLVDEFIDEVTLETIPGARVRDITVYEPDELRTALLAAGGFPPVRLLVAHVEGPAGSVTGVSFPGSETQRLS